MSHNIILGQCFKSVVKFLKILEVDKETWPHACIIGHSMTKAIYRFHSTDASDLQSRGLFTVAQLFKTNAAGRLTREFRDSLNFMIEPPCIFTRYRNNNWTFTKLIYLQSEVSKNFNNFSDCVFDFKSALSIYMVEYTNCSILYKKLTRQLLDAEIKFPPARATRLRDGVPVVPANMFIEAYRAVKHPLLPNKTKENAFQVLNRTIWTNNKAFKSHMRDDDECPYCGRTETMEHLLMFCENYAELQWEDLSKYITQLLRDRLGIDHISINIHLNQVFFHQENDRIKELYKKDKNIRLFFQALIHEIRRDIYYRKNSKPPTEQGIVHKNRRQAHLISVVKKLASYFQYIKHPKLNHSIEMAQELITVISNDV
jgi:hypothetical protein